MPLFEFICPEGHRAEHWREISDRDQVTYCGVAEHLDYNDDHGVMKRLPGGHGMLHFEEGRARVHIGLSDKPITSYAQQQKLMRAKGAVEGGNTVPASVASNPKSIGLKEFMSKDKKGKWL